MFGCMDPLACNFNPNATNSSNVICEFAPPGFGCDGQCLDFDDDGIVAWIRERLADARYASAMAPPEA